jgi:hypothetical protein
MNPAPTIDAMRQAARTLTVGDVRDKLHAVQAAQDALDAAKASLLAELEASKDFELDGASTLECLGAQPAADERRKGHRPGQERGRFAGSAVGG